jgi:hypothetical protein
MNNPFEVALNEGKVRKTPDNQSVSVLDMIEHLTRVTPENARKQWNRLCGMHLELVTYCHEFSFGPGRKTPVVDFEHAVQIIMLLPGIKAAKFRQDCARLLASYLQADITLADDIIQRNNNADEIEWIAKRAEGKVKRLALTDTMKEHGVRQPSTYIDVSNKTNRAVTGKTARQIKEERGVKSTRDGMTSDELVFVSAAEALQRGNIINKDAQGDRQVVSAVDEVIAEISPVFEKFRLKQVDHQAVQ